MQSFTGSGLGIIRAGMTSQYAVLGSPIAHSKSPLLHSAAFALSGIQATYSAIELDRGLGEFVSNLDSSWQGLSLTMPLKEEALDVASQLHPLAISTRAANTLIRVESSWLGYNTDVMGLQMAASNLSFQTVGILGTGATARSAAVAFEEHEITVWGRNSDKAVGICEAYGGKLGSLKQVLSRDLVISTLPAGVLTGLLEEAQTGTLLDVVYANNEVGGYFPVQISVLEMLLWQAIGQQRLFQTGQLEMPLEDEPRLLAAMRSSLVVGE